MAITDELRCMVRALSKEMHDLFREGTTPSAESGRPCKYCSLIDICVPKLTKKRTSVGKYVKRHVGEACDNDL